MNLQPRSEFPGTLIVQPDEAEQYLAQIEVDINIIKNAVAEAHTYAQDYTDRHFPVTAVGLARWLQTVYLIRSGLAADSSWEVSNPHNRPILKKDSGAYELAIAAGNSFTGIASGEGQPDLKRPAGKATARSVNEHTAPDVQTLFSISEVRTPEINSASDLPPTGTWFLLYYPDGARIRCELSRPTRIDSNSYVEGWAVRVLIGDVTEDANGDKMLPLPDIGG